MRKNISDTKQEGRNEGKKERRRNGEREERETVNKQVSFYRYLHLKKCHKKQKQDKRKVQQKKKNMFWKKKSKIKYY